METYDKQKAARVWQRVQNTAPEDPTRGLAGMIAEEWADAVTYLTLARWTQGRERTILQTMAQEEQAHMACLKGMYTLQGTGRPEIPAPRGPEKASLGTLLRRCYGREMRALAQYEARSADPEYGQIFARMAQQEREHCRQILMLLGSLKSETLG